MHRKQSALTAVALAAGFISLVVFALPTPSVSADEVTSSPAKASMCGQHGYFTDSKGYPVEWSGRLIGVMVSGEEIGLATVYGTNYPVFDVYLGNKLNIEKNFPEADGKAVITVKGYWQGIDCDLYRGIFGYKKYATNGQVCVPLVEAEEISIIRN